MVQHIKDLSREGPETKETTQKRPRTKGIYKETKKDKNRNMDSHREGPEQKHFTQRGHRTEGTPPPAQGQSLILSVCPPKV